MKTTRGSRLASSCTMLTQVCLTAFLLPQRTLLQARERGTWRDDATSGRSPRMGYLFLLQSDRLRWLACLAYVATSRACGAERRHRGRQRQSSRIGMRAICRGAVRDLE